MKTRKRLRIAIQKKGRLNQDSIDLLTRSGLKFRYDTALISPVENLPIDILFVRDDDIPTLVMDNICDIGIVGENVLLEQQLYQQDNGNNSQFDIVKYTGFSACRLAIAVPQEQNFDNLSALVGCRIATSYPYLLSQYLEKNRIPAEILNLSGSVEVAPRLQMANAICDLVSTGRTLSENNLKAVETVINSQAVIIKSSQALGDKQEIYDLLIRRINGVLAAKESKYILFHAPKKMLATITKLLPGSETPTVMPLGDDKVVVHLVSREGTFWVTLEKLKAAGASSILVLPIEKMLI